MHESTQWDFIGSAEALNDFFFFKYIVDLVYSWKWFHLSIFDPSALAEIHNFHFMTAFVLVCVSLG